jgi:hypothetical protein
MKNVFIFGGIIASILLIIFLYWTISPLFITTEVNDKLNPEVAKLIENTNNTDSPNDVVTDTSSIPEAEQIVTTGPFPIVDTPAHPASGSVRVIETADETIIRFENYEGTNGPDLYVYLANDLEANNFVDLGRAKGNRGNINYTVPDDMNIADYQYVMVWCKAFGVLFDYAKIN